MKIFIIQRLKNIIIYIKREGKSCYRRDINALELGFMDVARCSDKNDYRNEFHEL